MTAIYFYSSENAVQYQDDPENFPGPFRNVLDEGWSKKNGCTETNVQYNHYYSEDPGDLVSRCQLPSFRVFFQCG